MTLLSRVAVPLLCIPPPAVVAVLLMTRLLARFSWPAGALRIPPPKRALLSNMIPFVRVILPAV